MKKYTSVFVILALVISVGVLGLILPQMRTNQQVFALVIGALVLSLVAIAPKKLRDYLHDEANRMKGVKGEMEERGAFNVLFRIFAPIAIYFVFIGVLYMLVSPEAFEGVLPTVLFYLVAAGKEMVAPLAAGLVEEFGSVTLPIMIGALAFNDIICAAWMVLNWKVITFIPIFGRYLDKYSKTSRETVEEKEWLGKFSTVGLALLVTFPMRGSGGIVGPIIGKLLGMSGKNIFIAVTAGGIAGFAILVPAFYYAMDTIQRIFGVTTTWGVTAIMVAIVVGVIVTYKLIQKQRNSD